MIEAKDKEVTKMEETLGKRISANRKRLGLTQDKLAEQLGVTAQAVSKWENDPACPDIAMLPKLAEIFGTTTDALLGIESTVVHQAEVVQEESDTGDDRSGNNKWEFHWNAGRKPHLGFALWILLLGCLLLLSNLLNWNADIWELAWPSAILMYGLIGLFPGFRFSRIACTLVGAYYLLDNMGYLTDKLPAKLIFPVILVVLGISLLADAFRKDRKPSFRVTHNGGNSKKTKCDCYNGADSFSCDLSFGENVHRVDLPVLRSGEADLSFGELTVDLTGCRAVTEDCTIDADCSFGELRFLVPKRFAVRHDSDTAFASVSVNGRPCEEPEGVIYLDADTSFGNISIQYV